MILYKAQIRKRNGALSLLYVLLILFAAIAQST
jgi:hypothetical protein